MELNINSHNPLCWSVSAVWRKAMWELVTRHSLQWVVWCRTVSHEDTRTVSFLPDSLGTSVDGTKIYLMLLTWSLILHFFNVNNMVVLKFAYFKSISNLTFTWIQLSITPRQVEKHGRWAFALIAMSTIWIIVTSKGHNIGSKSSIMQKEQSFIQLSFHKCRNRNNSPFDTCCTVLVFGLPSSKQFKRTCMMNDYHSQWKKWYTGISQSSVYLVFWCARGQAFYFWSQINKHVSYSCNPGVKVFVFIELCAEILLIALPLPQTHNRAVHPAWKN